MASVPEQIPAARGRPPGPQDSGGVTFGSAGEPSDATMSRHLILIDQMIAWQIANPGKPWTQCAAALGLSTMWCRMVASSDAFKTRYQDVRDSVIKEIGLLGLKEKIAAAAEIAVERLAEKAAVAESMGDLTDATEMLLKAHYGEGGSKQGPAPISLTVNQTILDARDRILSGAVQQILPPAPVESQSP